MKTVIDDTIKFIQAVITQIEQETNVRFRDDSIRNVLKIFLRRYLISFQSINELFPQISQKVYLKQPLLLTIRSGLSDLFLLLYMTRGDASYDSINERCEIILTDHLKFFLGFYESQKRLFSEEEWNVFLNNIKADYGNLFEGDEISIQSLKHTDKPDSPSYIAKNSEQVHFKIAYEFYANFSKIEHTGLFSERVFDEITETKIAKSIYSLFVGLFECFKFLPLDQGSWLAYYDRLTELSENYHQTVENTSSS